MIEGLPPGPIANPGRAALEAVINPSRTRDLYFVADGTGGHTFAETLDQHNRNVVRWRQLEREARERPGAAPAVTVDQVSPDAAPAAPAAAAPAGPTPPRGTRGELPLPADTTTTAAVRTEDATAALAAQTAKQQGQPTPSRFSSLSFAAPGVENLFTQPRSMLDGPVDEPAAAGGDPQTYPMNPRLAAEQRARSARLGLPVADSSLEPVAPLPDPPVPRVVRIYDASEGTALDPLKDKSWDLNSAKTIPDLPSPGAPASTTAGRPPAKPTTRVAAQPTQAKPVQKPAPKVAAKPAKPKPKPAAADDDE